MFADDMSVKCSYHICMHIEKETRKLWEELDMPITLIMVMVSQVCAYVQTHQITYIIMYRVFFLSIIP